MIEIISKGRMCNQMFQYSFGRILSMELGYSMDFSLNWFPNTLSKVCGKSFTAPIERYSDDYELVDIKNIINNRIDRKIILNSYFQRFEYYKNYLKFIKNWFYQEPLPKLYHISKDSLIMHIRLTDYLDIGWFIGIDYYLKAIDSIKFNKLYICTDDLSSPLLKNFEKFNPILVNVDDYTTFRIIRSCNKIIISQSTFSWWAALLSNANDIIMPAKTGIWSSTSKFNIDLEVDDWHKIIVA